MKRSFHSTTMSGGNTEAHAVAESSPHADVGSKSLDKPVVDSMSDFNFVTPPEAVDEEYRAKAYLINRAIQEIGMGWYQYMLFAVVGFGWASDNLWPIVTSLILTPVGYEFHKASNRFPLVALAQNIGLLAGALFWGFGCDFFGRKWSFSLTLGFTSVFGLVAAGSPTFAAVGVFDALWSFGVGGNLPVDSAIFLEFLPSTHQYLLTVLSTYWAFAQVFATLIAWPLLGNLTCSQSEGCTKANNMGWRYFLIVMGGVWMILFVIRFLFPVLESPKYLMGKGHDEEAVRVIQRLAKYNGKTCSLSVEDLQRCNSDAHKAGAERGESTARAQMRRATENISLKHITGLFSTPSLAISTSLTIAIWALIGLAFPLYNIFLPYMQQSRNQGFLKAPDTAYMTYRNLVIIALMGIPACLLGACMVEMPRIGRKGSLALSTLLTGVFLYCSTTAKTWYALLGWQCAWNFSSAFMFAVLYTYTPEIFPSIHRGSGNALTACANRIFGVIAPIIGMEANLQTSAPVYVSGALFLLAGLLALLLPLEPRGKASM